MASAHVKDIARTVRGNLKRFIAIAVICALGIAMFCGLRASCQDLRNAADEFFDTQHLFDIQVLSTLGLDDDDLAALASVDGVDAVEGGWSESTYTDVDGARATVEVKALSDEDLNIPYIVEGKLPERAGEVAVTQKFVDASGLSIGDTIEIAEADNEDEAVFARRPYTITGIVIDAMDVSNPELSFRSSSTSDYTFIVSPDDVTTDTYTVAYLTVAGADELACYSDSYDERVAAVTDEIESKIREDRELARTATVKADAQDELDDARAEYEQERADAEAELADGRAELDDAAAQLADAKQELIDGQAEIDDGWAEVSSGEAELADGRAEFDRGAAEGAAEVERTLAEALAEGQAQIDNQIADGRAQGIVELDRKFEVARTQAQAELDAAIADGYDQGMAQLEDRLNAARDQAQAELDDQIEAARADAIAQVDAQFDEQRKQATDELDKKLEAARDEQYAAIKQKADTELAAQQLPGYDELVELRDNLQGELDTLRQTVDSYTEAESQLEDIESQLAALDADDPDNEQAIAELTAQAQQLQQVIGNVDAQGGIDALQGSAEELSERVSSIDTALAPIEQALDTVDDEIAKQREQGLAAIEEQLAGAYDEAISKVDEQIAAQREQAQAELEKRLDQEHAAALDKLKNEIEQQRADAQAKLDARMEQEYAAARAQLDQTIADERARAEATLEAQMAAGRDTAYAQLNAQLASARAELDDAAAQLADARAQLEEAQAELNDGRTEYEDGLADYQDGLAEWEDGRAEADKKFADAEAELADAQAEIDDIDTATWYVQTRSSLSSYSSVESDADSIEAIGTLFPIVFLVVAVLVSLTTITRLVEEERGLIGTYKALGYRNSEIYAKYLIYALAACLAGGIAGLILGFIALPAFIFVVFGIMYLLPGYAFAFDPVYGLGGMAIFIIAIGGTAYLACRSEVRQTPAELMRPKAPKSGSRIFLEHIPAIWSRLSFLNKVTARNLFRYKRRFLMTVSGIMGCTALIVCGFAIRDSVAELVPEQYERIAHYDIMAITNSGDHDDAARELADDSRVDELVRIYIDTATLKFADGEESVQLIVFPDDRSSADELSRFISVTDLDTSAAIDLPERGVVITQNASEVLGFAAHDTVDVQDSQLEQTSVEVANVARNYLGNYIYMSESAYRAAFGDEASALDDDGAFEPNGVLVRCSSDTDAEASLTTSLTDDARFLSVTSTSELADDFSQSFTLINAVVVIVLGMAAALAFAVLFTLSTTNISERERELATIKVLGFRPREVHHYVNKETIILTIIGIVCGLPFGYVLGDALLHVLKMPQISFLTVVTPLSYVLAAILPLVFALAVNLITNRTLNRIDMIEALKSVE